MAYAGQVAEDLSRATSFSKHTRWAKGERLQAGWRDQRNRTREVDISRMMQHGLRVRTITANTAHTQTQTHTYSSHTGRAKSCRLECNAE